MSNVIVGRMPDVRLGKFLLEHRQIFAALPLVTITVVDSTLEVAEMPWAKAELRRDPSWAVSLTPLVIPGDELVRLQQSVPRLFNGFDEIWVPGESPAEVRPLSVNIVGPRELDVEVPKGLVSWMASTGHRLGLGDGTGLNFVVRDEALGRQLGLL